jgi:hypothetical protein
LQIFLNGTELKDTKIEGVTELDLAGFKLEPGDNILALRPDPADGFFEPKNGDSRKLRIAALSITLTGGA